MNFDLIQFARSLKTTSTAGKQKRPVESRFDYAKLERRQVLTSISLPATTTDLDVFAAATENATVRINDESELVIRLTGEDNHVEINLQWGQIRVNPTSQEPVLAIEPDRYQKIVVLGEGHDKLVVTGNGLRSQLHPQRTWIMSENVRYQSGQEISVHGIGLEDVEIQPLVVPFTGSLVHDNVVRMFGSDGNDHLTMTDSTSATMIGEDYQYRASGLGRLFAFAKGGENLASVIGTREIPQYEMPEIATANPGDWHCAVLDDGVRDCFPFLSGDGIDMFYAADNYSQLQNSLLLARFFDFGTTRVDLLSGVDEVHVQDTQADSSWYGVEGESLVGSNRRFINAERITIDGTQIANDRLDDSGLSVGDFTDGEDEATLSFTRDTTLPLPESEKKYADLGQVIPDDFFWTWEAFEEVVSLD